MIEVEGEEDSILFLVDYVKNDVRWAQVDDIVIKWGDHKNSYKRFEILG
jgi:acylphosphatase